MDRTSKILLAATVLGIGVLILEGAMDRKATRDQEEQTRAQARAQVEKAKADRIAAYKAARPDIERRLKNATAVNDSVGIVEALEPWESMIGPEDLAMLKTARPLAEAERARIKADQDREESDRRMREEERAERIRIAEAEAAAEAARPKPVLKLASFQCTQDSIGNAIVEGSVRNISPEVIEGAVRVHASFYDADGKRLGSDSGYLSFKPLLLNQEAPFKIYGVRNPAYSRCSVDAMTIGGGTQVRWE